MEAIEILYRTPALVVCIKPVGVDAEHGLPQRLQSQLGGQIYTVHRLDQNVGGLMIFARTKVAAAELTQAMAQGRIWRQYLAMVHGTPPAAGIWKDLLFKDSRKNKVFVVKKARAGVKEASLEYTLEQTYCDRSLVKIRLHTGRSHQIRVQFASRGYPLVGDHKYGSRSAETAPLLWSWSISFPEGKEEKTIAVLPPWVEA